MTQLAKHPDPVESKPAPAVDPVSPLSSVNAEQPSMMPGLLLFLGGGVVLLLLCGSGVAVWCWLWRRQACATRTEGASEPTGDATA